MPSKRVIRITEKELRDEMEQINPTVRDNDKHSGSDEDEDFAADSAIIITTDDIAQGDIRSLFQTSLMQEFVDYISAGLPKIYLSAHPELLRIENLNKIGGVIEQIPDQALKNHLASRLDVAREFGGSQKAYS